MEGLLYGHNKDTRIVAVQHLSDRTVRVYFREDDHVRYEDAPLFPFFFCADRQLLAGFPKKHWIKLLSGTAYYQYLCVFEEWSAMWDAVRFILDRFNQSAINKISSYTEIDLIHLISDPVSQYLMQSGRTLFKGMGLQDVHRLQLDIETYTTAPFRFPNALRPGDRIILIALSDNRGWHHLIDGKKFSEKEMLAELVSIITKKDPDVIEGHNIFNFDLPYISRRCELHRVNFGIGRDGTPPRTFETRTSFAERPFEYTVSEIAGRHVVDTLILLQSYDTSKRELDGYGLKSAARHFGFASPDRTYIKGDKISWHWDNDVKPLMDYALDDVHETGKLAEHLSGTSFYLTQMLPHNYGQAARMGSAGKIEGLMVREYLREKQSLPRPSEGNQTSGGYTDIFVRGVLGPILHVDVESLYPSIMINENVTPLSDSKGIFNQLLSALTRSRLDMKRSMRRMPEGEEKSRLDAMQSSLKILINSFYGYLGYSKGLFNDFAQADLVTTTGQRLLKQMIAHIIAEKGKVIEVDTDGIYFVPPESVKTKDDEEAFVNRLGESMPGGISIALDGRYYKMLSYKKKNYALLGYDQKIKIKGSSLISRSIEKFGRAYLQRCLDFLLTKDLEGLHNLYVSVYSDILAHKLDVRDFARTESLKDSLVDYKREVDAGKRNKSAAYEVAVATDHNYKPGDQISYYITGIEANPKGFENCKSAQSWDPNFPDENVPYYIRRLDELSEKFVEFFRPEDFRAIFSPDDLFPFSAAGIIILTSDISEKSGQSDDESPLLSSTRISLGK